MVDYEKKYEEALATAKDCLKDGTVTRTAIDYIETIFPELKESEDEKIRKALIEALKRYNKRHISNNNRHPHFEGIEVDKALSWLEKQGEKKPTEVRTIGYWQVEDAEHKPLDYENANIQHKDFAPEQEPKFKVGDWLASNICNSSDLLHIIDVDDKNYEIETPQGNTGVPSIAYIDNNFHLWTIKDARAGDILTTGKSVFIYAKVLYIKQAYAYCGVDKFGVFKDNCLNNNWTICLADIRPATKEERDTLMKAMADAGYEWNAEKKELKKIKDEIEIPFGAKDSELQEETYYIPKGFHAEIDDDKVVIKKGEKPATWSKEDEHRIEDTIYFLDTAKKHYASTIELDACIDWLKSIKNRIGG